MSTLRTMMTNASAPLHHWLERVEAELDFAGRFCELHPHDAGVWHTLIQQARAVVVEALTNGRLDDLPNAVRNAETLLAPIGKVAKTYTVHCVGHGHIDMNWMWSWPETVAITVDTFSTVLRLMDEYPEFNYSQSQASTFAVMERHRPDLLKRIVRRVKEGRWEITASHWVEGDKNMAGGESLCRHLLYTRAYMKQLFGLRPEDVPIDWSPDTFGHAATVPTYLVRGGIKYLYLHRPGVHTASKPGAFWWEGPDGSRVLVRNDMELGYNGQIAPDLIPHFCKFVQLTGGRDYMFVFGVGDHGGGPTRRDILRGRDMATWPVFPAIQFSTVRAFYERLEKQAGRLPLLTGELNTEFTGCYTTETLIKKANRFSENRLVDAELASVMAWGVAGQRYPAEAFLEAWRDTLFSQFHDILPGSGVHDTRTYTHGLFQKTMATTSQIELQALRLLAAQVDTSSAGATPAVLPPPSRLANGLGAGVGFRSADGDFTQSEQSSGSGPRPFVLFNPTTRDRAEIVEVTVWDNQPGIGLPLKTRPFSVRQSDGTIIAPQVVTGGSYWGHDFVTLAFPVKVAGLGYTQCAVAEESTGGTNPLANQIGWVHHCGYAVPERSVEGLENEFLRVEFDPVTGGIRSLLDKRSNLKVINESTGPARLEYAVEVPHGMTAWCVDHIGAVQNPVVTGYRRGLTGPYKASFEFDLRVHESTITLAYELLAGDPKLHLQIKAVWFQRGSRETGIPMLRLAIPLALAKAQARFEIPFGAIDRSLNQGEEVPALQWAQVTGQTEGQAAGCLLLNDCKYGHALDGSTLMLTLIRSSYDPDILPEIGRHEMRVALQPLAGELSVAEAIHIGQEFNHALRVTGTDIHQGRLAATGRFVKIAPDSIVLSTIKKAENGSAVVVRVVNPTGQKVTARIDFDAGLFRQVTEAEEVDLMERPLAKPSVKVTENSIRVAVPAHGLASVLVKIKR